MTTETIEYRGTGRRKSSVARVRIREGTGDILINGREFQEYFPRDQEKIDVLQVLEAADQKDKLDIICLVNGGGYTGQSGAVRLGLARALTTMNAELRDTLHEGGFLTRDSRMKERKKYGLRGARRGFQFSKR